MNEQVSHFYYKSLCLNYCVLKGLLTAHQLGRPRVIPKYSSFEVVVVALERCAATFAPKLNNMIVVL